MGHLEIDGQAGREQDRGKSDARQATAFFGFLQATCAAELSRDGDTAGCGIAGER
jgi:hypothetical protein